MKSQPRLKKGRREQLPSCVENRIWEEVDRCARRFGCSRSWVVSTALADAMGIDLEPEFRYDHPEEKPRNANKSRPKARKPPTL